LGRENDPETSIIARTIGFARIDSSSAHALNYGDTSAIPYGARAFRVHNSGCMPAAADDPRGARFHTDIRKELSECYIALHQPIPSDVVLERNETLTMPNVQIAPSLVSPDPSYGYRSSVEQNYIIRYLRKN
jgi:hypothetical protein